jgi:CubicO group peptidase (beta-lactamase class C family)
MAKVSAIFANGGEVDGVRLLKSETVDLSLSEPTKKLDFMLGMQCTFTKGGHSVIEELTSMCHVNIPEAYLFKGLEGWHGAGGSLMYFNKDKNITFAYAMNGGLNDPHNAPRTLPMI